MASCITALHRTCAHGPAKDTGGQVPNPQISLVVSQLLGRNQHVSSISGLCGVNHVGDQPWPCGVVVLWNSVESHERHFLWVLKPRLFADLFQLGSNSADEINNKMNLTPQNN